MVLATKSKAKSVPKAARQPKQQITAPVQTTVNMNGTATIVQVQAYTAEHAKRVTAALYGVSMAQVMDATPEARKVTQAKKTKSADFPQKGTRKWETEYQIFTYAQQIQVGLNKFDYIGLELVKGGFASKTEAVSVMKAMAVKHRLPMMVQIAKVLKGDSNVTAIAEPDEPMVTFTVKFWT